MPGVLQAPKSCLVARCSYVGPNRALSVHWRVAHEDRTILFLCPLPGCSYHPPRQHNLRTHWERVHGATRPTSAELRTLPLLADFAVNRNRVDPGECCPPVPPPPPCGCQSGACPIATSIPCLSGCRWSCRGSSRSRSLQPHSSTPLWVGLSQRPQRYFRQRKPASQGNRMQPRWRQESRVRPPRKDRQFRGPSVSQMEQLASVHHHAVCHSVPLTHHLCHLQPSRSCHPHLSP